MVSINFNYGFFGSKWIFDSCLIIVFVRKYVRPNEERTETKWELKVVLAQKAKAKKVGVRHCHWNKTDP